MSFCKHKMEEREKLRGFGWVGLEGEKKMMKKLRFREIFKESEDDSLY